MNSSHRTGLAGERIAARWLRRRGWRVLETNCRIWQDEIDIIAESPAGDTIAFIEVKSSGVHACRRLEDRVGSGKRSRLRRSAIRLCARFPNHFVRIDVMTICLKRWWFARVRHMKNVVQIQDS